MSSEQIRQSVNPASEQLSEPRYELIPTSRIIERAAATLPAHSTVSVTCSPAQGVDETVIVSVAMASHFARVIPHIAARMVHGEQHLADIVDKLSAAGLDEIFVVGGDQAEPLGPYRRGLDLLQALAHRDHGIRRIGVPAYPEGHPHIADDVLAQDLKEKTQYADYAVTQMTFDASGALQWLRGLRKADIRLPVYFGIPGPVRPDKLLRIAGRIGVTDSIRFLRSNLRLTGRLLRGYDAGELVKVYAPHIHDPDYGIGGFHIYTFNELDGVEAWRRRWALPTR